MFRTRPKQKLGFKVDVEPVVTKAGQCLLSISFITYIKWDWEKHDGQQLGGIHQPATFRFATGIIIASFPY